MINADIDECAEQTFNCPMHSTCANTVGSYRCNCSGEDCRGTLPVLLATINMLPHVVSLQQAAATSNREHIL